MQGVALSAKGSGRDGTSRHSSTNSSHGLCSSSSEPFSFSPPQEESAGYQGLAAIAGNLAASLSDMLGSDADDITLVTEDDAQQAQHGPQQGQQAQHSSANEQAPQVQQVQHAEQAQYAQQAQQPQRAQQSQQAQHGGSLRGYLPSFSLVGKIAVTGPAAHESLHQQTLGRSASRSAAEDGAGGSSPLGQHASAVAQRLQERALAAMALSEAATARSSVISGLTDLHPQAHGDIAGASNAHVAAAVVSNNMDLQVRAAAAMAALEAATAASSSVSDLTEIQLPFVSRPTANHSDVNHPTHSHPAAASEIADVASCTVSGLSDFQGRTITAAALTEAVGAASSTVSGMTEVAAAGASMTDPAAGLASGANPFGLSSAHSVDCYALLNATSTTSSVVSGMAELLAHPSASPDTSPYGIPHVSSTANKAASKDCSQSETPGADLIGAVHERDRVGQMPKSV